MQLSDILSEFIWAAQSVVQLFFWGGCWASGAHKRAFQFLPPLAVYCGTPLFSYDIITLMKRPNQNGFGLTLVLLAIALVIIIGFAVFKITQTGDNASYPVSSTQTLSGKQNNNSDTSYMEIGNDEAQITGTITSEYNDLPRDGAKGIVIADKYHVNTDIGGDLSTEQRSSLVFGSVEEVKVGDKVKVYAKIINPTTSQIIGKKSYYVQKLQ